MRITGFAWVLLLVCCGCGKGDKEKLARVGQVAAARAEGLAGKDSKIARRWNALRADLDEMALDARISARLRWDQALKDSQITVSAKGGQVELKGSIKDLNQKQRAVDLARSTTGVENVVDAMTLPNKEP